MILIGKFFRSGIRLLSVAVGLAFAASGVIAGETLKKRRDSIPRETQEGRAHSGAKRKYEPLKYGSALLFEPATGRVLYHHNAGRRTYPASLVKMMTAYVAFETVEEGRATQRYTMDSMVRFSDHARSQPATRVGLKKGIDVSLDTALRALVIRSANDFAVAIAETISGSEAVFIQRMNQTARRLGMLSTHFANPHGLPNARQVSTARDIALLTSAIMREYPEYADIFSDPDVSIRTLTLHTHNGLLRTLEGADGMKTGFTCASGYNIVASATRDGRRLAVVIIGALTGADRTRRATFLLNEGFDQLKRGEPKGNLTLASLPDAKTIARETLDLSQKTRTWVCGNAPKPRKYRKKRKRRKTSRRRRR